MKNFNKHQLEELLKKTENSFLSKEDRLFYIKEFEFGYESFREAMIYNKIPFKCGHLSTSLKCLGINSIGNVITYNDFLLIPEKYLKEFERSKIKITFECSECKKKGQSTMKNFLTRKFLQKQIICSKCINKKVGNLEERIKINSDAQLIAQNKPEIKEKNRQAQLERFKDPIALKKHSDAGKKTWQNPEYRKKMEKIAKEKWDDVEYAKKVIEHSKNGGLKGYYKNLYYDSGYELAYLMMMNDKGELNKIERSYVKIVYKDEMGDVHRYFPDFIYNNKIIIEVKGYAPWVNLNLIYCKNKEAANFAKQNKMEFRIIELKDFGYRWYRKAREYHKKNKNNETKK